MDDQDRRKAGDGEPFGGAPRSLAVGTVPGVVAVEYFFLGEFVQAVEEGEVAVYDRDRE
jgi:hypothetical protein